MGQSWTISCEVRYSARLWINLPTLVFFNMHVACTRTLYNFASIINTVVAVRCQTRDLVHSSSMPQPMSYWPVKTLLSGSKQVHRHAIHYWSNSPKQIFKTVKNVIVIHYRGTCDRSVESQLVNSVVDLRVEDEGPWIFLLTLLFLMHINETL